MRILIRMLFFLSRCANFEIIGKCGTVFRVRKISRCDGYRKLQKIVNPARDDQNLCMLSVDMLFRKLNY